MYRRHLSRRLLDSLAAFPAVLLLGPRQVGKSTLVQELRSAAWSSRYLTLDDRTTLDAATTDPDGFIAGTPTPVAIDEVQRAPDLLRAIKLSIDRDRSPGRFLLTGSANVLTLSSVSETLAGRVAVHELAPFAWSELRQVPAPTVLDRLFIAASARDLVADLGGRYPGTRPELMQRVLVGGMPTPALMQSAATRATWFESYRRTYLERDVLDVARVDHVADFSRLLVTLALRTGQMLNVAELSRDVGIPGTSLRRYLRILEQTWQVRLLPPFATNLEKRLVKTPKLYFDDCGIACHLASLPSWDELERRNRVGSLVENWVHGELRKLLALQPAPMQLSYWRTHTGREVDFVLERGGEAVGIEVKWSAGLDARHFAGLAAARSALGERWRLGVVLHGGEDAVALDERTAAIPFAALFLPAEAVE